jgi:exopolysaccharide/PEP-CTERM locus tyrosine autokinase
MSLVEQAIARMRNQANAAKSATAVVASKAPTLPAAPSALLEPSRITKRMNLDLRALRAQGYLPEEGKDREFADHYRRIKRPLIDKALSATTAVGEPRVIMITSALPGDGKTFTCVNLALSMALERDISVMLVDCDVAKRHVSEIAGLGEEKGLLDALIDESVDIESLAVQTDLRGLSIVPAGRRVEATAELLSSIRMRQLVNTLCARDPRRIVLLDSPPLLITNEGRTLVKIAGQVVLVIRAGRTPRHAVQEAVALFDPQQAGGLVLNQLAVGSSEAYYGYEAYGSYEAIGSRLEEP